MWTKSMRSLHPRARTQVISPVRQSFLRRFSAGFVGREDEKKDAMLDRHKMNTEANEYSKSSSDTDTGANSRDAFDPNSSNEPEKEMQDEGEDRGSNPLGMSPANPDASSPTREESSGEGETPTAERQGTAVDHKSHDKPNTP